MRALLFSMKLAFIALGVSVAAAVNSNEESTSRDAWSGYWLGDLPPAVGDLRLLLRVPLQEEDRHFSRAHPVALYSLDQGGGKISANNVEFDKKHQRMTFYFDVINGRYEAELDEANKVMQGKWYQGSFDAPLEMQRFQETDAAKVPREFRFVLQKSVSGPPADLQKLVGYWSGYLDDSFDDEEPEPPELVILQVEKITDDLVEPQVYLPDETPLAIGLRSFVLNGDQVKAVLDDPLSANNAIFEGTMEDKTIKGVVRYDDTDYTPPLVLTWTEDPPTPKQRVDAKEG